MKRLFAFAVSVCCVTLMTDSVFSAESESGESGGWTVYKNEACYGGSEIASRWVPAESGLVGGNPLFPYFDYSIPDDPISKLRIYLHAQLPFGMATTNLQAFTVACIRIERRFSGDRFDVYTGITPSLELCDKGRKEDADFPVTRYGAGTPSAFEEMVEEKVRACPLPGLKKEENETTT